MGSTSDKYYDGWFGSNLGGKGQSESYAVKPDLGADDVECCQCEGVFCAYDPNRLRTDVDPRCP